MYFTNYTFKFHHYLTNCHDSVLEQHNKICPAKGHHSLKTLWMTSAHSTVYGSDGVSKCVGTTLDMWLVALSWGWTFWTFCSPSAAPHLPPIHSSNSCSTSTLALHCSLCHIVQFTNMLQMQTAFGDLQALCLSPAFRSKIKATFNTITGRKITTDHWLANKIWRTCH